MSEKVSVIVASYNHGEFIQECLESALSQTYDNLEVIVVDDQSTDDSVEIARGLSDPRLKVVRNKKKLGTYGTEQAGLELASGQWIAILNSDDYWSTKKLEKQIAALQKYDGLWSYTLGKMVDHKGRPMRETNHGNWPTDEVQDLLPLLLDNNRVLASSTVFRRDAASFRKELRYCGDWVANLWLAEHAPAICVPEHLTFWRQHENNSYRRSEALTLEEIMVRRAILDRREEWMEHGKSSKAVAQGLSSCAMNLSALYVLAGQMRLARAAAKMATNISPSNLRAHRRRLVTAMPKRLAQRRLWPSEPPVPLADEALVGKREIL
jgi:glycosyltransferase involved in cell wall biosynthesis